VNLIQAIVLGGVEGLTEFLPVSSTGHLRITEEMFGLEIDSDAVTGFTAVIQVGAIIAVFVYFARDIWNIIVGWLRGLRTREARASMDYKMGWYVIVATIPISVVGLLAKNVIEDTLSNLWWVASALIFWSVVMVVAERVATQRRSEADMTMRDAIAIGVVQTIALIPGISRSGATISAGLFNGLDRVTATRMSFFMSIPAIVGATVIELPNALSGEIGAVDTVVATVVSFVVAYAAIAWLLRFVAHHPITWFVPYRVGLGVVLLALLATGTISAT
jgi:undecaprenyl-diphosphatase